MISNMKSICFAFLSFFILMVDCAYSTTNQTYDFKLIENRIIVEMEVNNETLHFIFDTGSDDSVIDSARASKMGYHALSPTFMPTAAGSIHAYQTDFKLLKEYKLYWLTTSCQYLSTTLKCQIDGLLGVKKIMLKEMIDIDFENLKIRIGHTDEKLNQILLRDGNKAQGSDFGRAFSSLPVFEGNISFKDHQTKKIDFILDTGCHFDFVLLTEDSLFIKANTGKPQDYLLFDGRKTGTRFGRVGTNGRRHGSRPIVPFFYSPVLHVYKNESLALVGLPTLRKFKRIIIDWPDRVMYVKRRIKF